MRSRQHTTENTEWTNTEGRRETMNAVHTLLHTHKTHEWNVINLFSVLEDDNNSKEFYYYLMSSRDGFRSFNGTFFPPTF